MKTQTFQRAASSPPWPAALPMFAQADHAVDGARARAQPRQRQNTAPLDLSVNNKVFPEVDISSALLQFEHRRTGADLSAEAHLKAGGTEIGSPRTCCRRCRCSTTSPTWAPSSPTSARA